MAFLLDTNIVSRWVRAKRGPRPGKSLPPTTLLVAERIEATEQIAVSVATQHELQRWLRGQSNARALLALQRLLLGRVVSAEDVGTSGSTAWDRATSAYEAAREAKVPVPADFDLLILGTAMAHDACLVTNDGTLKDCAAVQQHAIRVEDWVEDPTFSVPQRAGPSPAARASLVALALAPTDATVPSGDDSGDSGG